MIRTMADGQPRDEDQKHRAQLKDLAFEKE